LGLKRIDARALNGTPGPLVVIPSTICFIASTAFDSECPIPRLDHNSCPEFEWRSEVRGLDSTVDFRRIHILDRARGRDILYAPRRRYSDGQSVSFERIEHFPLFESPFFESLPIAYPKCLFVPLFMLLQLKVSAWSRISAKFAFHEFSFLNCLSNASVTVNADRFNVHIHLLRFAGNSLIYAFKRPWGEPQTGFPEVQYWSRPNSVPAFPETSLIRWRITLKKWRMWKFLTEMTIFWSAFVQLLKNRQPNW
jgi:hypothetical protein